MTDIIRKRGDTYAHEIEVTSESTGSVIDIAGFSFLLTVDTEKLPSNSDNNLFQITGSITDGPNGLVEFVPTPQQADNVGNYFYDIQMTDGAGRIRTIDSGKYKVIQDITK